MKLQHHCSSMNLVRGVNPILGYIESSFDVSDGHAKDIDIEG
jgi:hypothetical protein